MLARAMSTPHTFEQLLIWQEARRLTHSVYLLTAAKPWHSDRSLRDQVRRAAVSIMANIAEGFERGSQREFARFLAIAKGSAGELRSHFYAAEDLGYARAADLRSLRQHAAMLARQIQSMRVAARDREDAVHQKRPSAGQA
jgi:four helix bundle protein